jgi:hypothetical protein
LQAKRAAPTATREYEARKDLMDAPQEEFYSKPETEVWIAFDCRGPAAKNHLHRERRAWGAAATVESLGYGRAVLVVRPGDALEIVR